MREGTHCALTFLAFANAALGWGWDRTRPRFPAQRLREGESILAFSLPNLSLGTLCPWRCFNIWMWAIRMIEVAFFTCMVRSTTRRAFRGVTQMFRALFDVLGVGKGPG